MPNDARGFKTFDHTADIGLEIWGDTFNAIFEEVGKALFSLIVESGEIVPKERFAIELSAESGEDLFLKWLKELLYVFETKKMVFSEFRILNLEPWTLTAEVGGERLDPRLHKLAHEVKAITRYLFEFKKTKAGFSARVIVDI